MLRIATILALGVIAPYFVELHAQAGGAGAQRDSVSAQDLLPARVVRDATTAYNAPATQRVRGEIRIPPDSVIPGDLAIQNGQLTIAGHIRGRVIAVNADVLLEPTARVDRDILVVGGMVGRRENGRVRGDIRFYRTRLIFTESGDSIVADARYTDEGGWWSNLQVDSPRNRSKITVLGETYNRVEGLPVLIGPTFRRVTEDFTTHVDLFGIIRTADRVRWDADNIGHKADFSVRMNSAKGVQLGAGLYDVVEPIERWQVSDHEAGLGTFALHRDFRDYYGRHGGEMRLTLFRGYERELELSYGHERWVSRVVRDTWTLFRDDKPWRPNPDVNQGRMHVLAATLRVDTRNSETNPWTGWYVTSRLERGTGDLDWPDLPGVVSRSEYSRLMLDARRYNRLSPHAQLNFRLVYGGRLGDDALPLQKRFSVGGPGSLPGFDFRRLHGGTDVGMCSNGTLLPGSPALCERMALAQVEYRGDIQLDLFNSGSRNDEWRDLGHHPGAQWVIFADAGRGWLLNSGAGTGSDDLSYDSGTLLPPPGTFRTDIGVGLDMGFIGVFAAKAVSQSGVPANFFVRLRHRF